MFPFFAGLAAGLLHVFSGPDHLAAIAPLAAEQKRGQWRTGLQWGVGHTIGVLLIAWLLLLIRDRLPFEAISGYSERLVGFSLIAIGLWGVWKARRTTSVWHSHSGASFIVGVVHGVAGSSHLVGVLPALTFATPSESWTYLAGFGVAAMAGMSAFAAGIGALSIRFGHRTRWLFASSAAALIVGGFWLVGR
jgi:hypothetical protein